MSTYDKKQLWFISLTPEFMEHEKIQELKFFGKADLIFCFLEIAYYSAKQDEPYCIEYLPHFSSIQQQLSVFLHWEQRKIEETFSEFVPLGWIVCLDNSKINVPIAIALTTNKKYGAIKKSEQRGKSVPTIKIIEQGGHLSANCPPINKIIEQGGQLSANCPPFVHQENKNTKISSSSLSIQGNFNTSNIDRSSTQIPLVSRIIIEKYGLEEKEIIKATLEAEKNKFHNANPENRKIRIAANIERALNKINRGGVPSPAGYIYSCIRNNWQL